MIGSWQAMFSVSLTNMSNDKISSTPSHLHFDNVDISTSDMFDSQSSVVIIPSRAIYYFYFTIEVEYGASANLMLNYWPRVSLCIFSHAHTRTYTRTHTHGRAHT